MLGPGTKVLAPFFTACLLEPARLTNVADISVAASLNGIPYRSLITAKAAIRMLIDFVGRTKGVVGRRARHQISVGKEELAQFKAGENDPGGPFGNRRIRII